MRKNSFSQKVQHRRHIWQYEWTSSSAVALSPPKIFVDKIIENISLPKKLLEHLDIIKNVFVCKGSPKNGYTYMIFWFRLGFSPF